MFVTLLPLDVAELQQAGAAGSRRETSLDHAAVDCQQAHLYHLHRRIAEVKANGLQIRRHLLPPAGMDGVVVGENPLQRQSAPMSLAVLAHQPPLLIAPSQLSSPAQPIKLTYIE